MGLVISFEDIFLCNKSENGDCFVKNGVNFVVGFLLDQLIMS